MLLCVELVKNSGVTDNNTYLYGRKFVLVTDHKPLTTILGPYKGVPTIAAARLQRWALILSGYHYEIEFRPTKAHGNADGLSRLPLPSDTQEIASIEPNIFNISQIKSLPVTVTQLKQATSHDPVLSKVIRYTQRGWQRILMKIFVPFSSVGMK